MADWTIEKQMTYRTRLEEKANGVPVLTATDECQAALQTLDARSLAILSPIGEKQAHGAQEYYKSLGYDVPCDMAQYRKIGRHHQDDRIADNGRLSPTRS